MSRDVELPQAHTMETKFDFALWLSWLNLTLVRYLVMATLKQRKRAKKLADERRVVLFCFQYNFRKKFCTKHAALFLSCVWTHGLRVLYTKEKWYWTLNEAYYFILFLFLFLLHSSSTW